MSQTVRTLGAVALGAFIVAVAALSVRPGPAAGAPATDTPAAHTITVSGSGTITVVPDVARIYLGVTVTKPTVKAARQAGAQAMTDIIAAVKSLGIAEADIQTTNVSLNPQYGSGSAPKVVGYQISEQIEVTVRDLDKAGDVVDSATADRRDERQRDLVRAGRPGQGPERGPCRRGRRRPDERTGDGERRQRVPRCGRLDHRCDPVLADLLRLRRAEGRCGPGPRDAGGAGDTGPQRDRHGRLRDQLTSAPPRRPGAR